ncbi:hypothetical protein BH10BAC1_BH10BAC1_05560 [soil metagenome]
MPKINSRAFTTWIGENDICYTVVKENVVVEIADAIENSSSVSKLSDGKTYPMLVNLKEIKSISKEARDHFSMQNRTPGVKAIGLLIKSPASTIIGNFFLGLNKSTVPVKLFNKEEKAVTWLKQFNKK